MSSELAVPFRMRQKIFVLVVVVVVGVEAAVEFPRMQEGQPGHQEQATGACIFIKVE